MSVLKNSDEVTDDEVTDEEEEDDQDEVQPEPEDNTPGRKRGRLHSLTNSAPTDTAPTLPRRRKPSGLGTSRWPQDVWQKAPKVHLASKVFSPHGQPPH